ncbi:MAG: helix-turn-helix domain-containing protein [Pyrinomonadaceae bacterium]
MSNSLPPPNRFFVSSDFSVYYRTVKQLTWQTPPTTAFGLLNVIDGDLTFRTGERTGEMTTLDSLILDANQVLTINGKTVQLLYLTMSPLTVVQHAVSMHLVVPQSTVGFSTDVIRSDPVLQGLTRNITVELTTEKPGREMFMHALAEQVTIHLLRRYATVRQSEELELSRVGLIDRRIRRSVELMHAQLDQNLSLRTIAAASFLSPFHFARLFKQLMGVTPHNYLAAVRSNRAAILLAQTDISVTQIAARVGYQSSSHFTKAFRQATGATPREFRKALITS